MMSKTEADRTVYYAVFSASRKAYLTKEYGLHQWSRHAIDARVFETMAGTLEFIRLSGWVDSTDYRNPSAVYVTEVL